MDSTNAPTGPGAPNGRKIIKQPAISPGKKQMGANERAPGALAASVPSKSNPGNMPLEAADGPRGGAIDRNGPNSENSLFNKHYNKELKLCEDEIPMVLCELNESALAYLNREQFENALLLLQKAHGVLDVVDLTGSNRDQNIAL